MSEATCLKKSFTHNIHTRGEKWKKRRTNPSRLACEPLQRCVRRCRTREEKLPNCSPFICGLKGKRKKSEGGRRPPCERKAKARRSLTGHAEKQHSEESRAVRASKFRIAVGKKKEGEGERREAGRNTLKVVLAAGLISETREEARKKTREKRGDGWTKSVLYVTLRQRRRRKNAA